MEYTVHQLTCFSIVHKQYAMTHGRGEWIFCVQHAHSCPCFGTLSWWLLSFFFLTHFQDSAAALNEPKMTKQPSAFTKHVAETWLNDLSTYIHLNSSLNSLSYIKIIGNGKMCCMSIMTLFLSVLFPFNVEYFTLSILLVILYKVMK